MPALKLSRVFVLIMLLVVGVAMPTVQGEPRIAQTREKPNVILIFTDDLDAASVSEMPNVQSRLVDRGTTFKNAFVTDPLCCPSRATFLRGQYPHNTRIMSNSPPLGGHEKFRGLGLDRSTVATWLDDAGYDTIYLGKYMNGYDDTTYVPPGWDRWFGWLGNYHSPGGRYRLNENGNVENYNLDRIHDTDLLGEKAVHFIRNQRGDGRPFFMWLAPNAPHTPAYIPERHEGMFSDRSLPRPPSFNEEGVSDKPEWVQRPGLGHAEVKDVGDLYRKRLAAMQSVDEMIEDLIRALRDTGQLDGTYVVFTSDNGFLFGEHRRVKKSMPYEESIKIPLVVRGPGVAHQRLDHLVINNDFAPTMAELAGVAPPSFVDGKSFAPLLRNEKPGVRGWREGFLVEHRDPTYQALRTNEYAYVEWSGGDRELYDLRNDPYQLHSIHETADPALTGDLERRLDLLRSCAAEECRAAEQP